MDKKYLAAVHSILGLGLNKYYFSFIQAFGSWESVWQIKSQPQGSDVPTALWDKLLAEKKKVDPDRVINVLFDKGIRIIARNEENYPSLLLHIHNIPCMLYYYGDITLAARKCVAVIGARKATPYGLAQSRRFSGELARRGITIVSGMARGIDSSAHEGALQAGGKTAAVLGSGIDIVYPRENRKLFERIKDEGLIISEFPLGTPPLSGNFPIRNRIISGLSQGVFVVEAEAQSGSLITVDFALEQGRDVFALPGCVTSPQSIGTLRLIQNGAKMVIYPQDILEELGIEYRNKLLQERQVLQKEMGPQERKILEAISWEPVHLNELLHKNSNCQGIFEILLELELKGLLKQLPGKYYVRV